MGLFCNQHSKCRTRIPTFRTVGKRVTIFATRQSKTHLIPMLVCVRAHARLLTHTYSDITGSSRYLYDLSKTKQHLHPANRRRWRLALQKVTRNPQIMTIGKNSIKEDKTLIMEQYNDGRFYSQWTEKGVIFLFSRRWDVRKKRTGGGIKERKSSRLLPNIVRVMNEWIKKIQRWTIVWRIKEWKKRIMNERKE